MIRLAAIFCLLACQAAALDLSLPAAARQTAERQTSADIYHAPTGAFVDGTLPTTSVEGEIHRSAWRIERAGVTPLQAMRPLREQVIEAGYEIVLDCDSATCGGFDFRFATEVLLGPHMYVNIRDYHFVTGVRQAEGMVDEAITLLTSSTASAAYVQIIRAQSAALVTDFNIVSQGVLESVEDDVAQDALEAKMLRDGHVVLDDLDFDVGTTELGAGPFASLIWLSAFLQSQPDQRIALVGHTDTVGGLQTNIAVSRARARSVRQRLIESYGIDGAQLDAEGMGYLAPRANNLSSEGRQQNRRVEVILLSKS